MDFGTGVTLTAPEVHALARIAATPGLHATALAEATGVTRGAVAQLLARLERKGMIRREPDPGNASRRLIALTLLGKKAVAGHERFHERLDGHFLGLLDRVPDLRLGFLSQFMEQALKALDDYET